MEQSNKNFRETLIEQKEDKTNLPGIKYWILERTADLDQLTEILIPEWKKGNLLYWGDFAFVPIGKAKLSPI